MITAYDHIHALLNKMRSFRVISCIIHCIYSEIPFVILERQSGMVTVSILVGPVVCMFTFGRCARSCFDRAQQDQQQNKKGENLVPSSSFSSFVFSRRPLLFHQRETIPGPALLHLLSGPVNAPLSDCVALSAPTLFAAAAAAFCCCCCLLLLRLLGCCTTKYESRTAACHFFGIFLSSSFAAALFFLLTALLLLYVSVFIIIIFFFRWMADNIGPCGIPHLVRYPALTIISRHLLVFPFLIWPPASLHDHNHHHQPSTSSSHLHPYQNCVCHSVFYFTFCLNRQSRSQAQHRSKCFGSLQPFVAAIKSSSNTLLYEIWFKCNAFDRITNLS